MVHFVFEFNFIILKYKNNCYQTYQKHIQKLLDDTTIIIKTCLFLYIDINHIASKSYSSLNSNVYCMNVL